MTTDNLRSSGSGLTTGRSGAGQPIGVPRLVGRALVVDDHAESLAAIAHALRSAGCTVEEVSDPAAVLARLELFSPDVLIADVRMPGTDGFTLLEQVRERDPLLPTVLITGFGNVPDAVRAIHRGALHYLTKPFDRDELLRVVQRALALQRARRTGRAPHAVRGTVDPLDAIVGDTPAMRELTTSARSAAAGTAPVLIHGEPGSGKDHVARAIHAASPRAGAPLVRFDCAGAERDALHDACDGATGTLVLDDVAELPLAQQSALPAILDAAAAGRGPRIIALTSQDLAERVADGSFRADVYHRLAVAALELPPLRDRRADVRLLAEHLATRIAGESARTPPRLDDAALVLLERHDWPGNVRELEAALRDALPLASDGVVTAVMVQPRLTPSPRVAAPRVPGARFDEVERYTILATYESCGRNALRTAEVLGLSPRTVHYRLREYRGQVGRRKRERG